MKRSKIVLPSSTLLVIILSICALVLGVGAVGRNSGNALRRQTQPRRIQNQTHSFEVIETREVMKSINNHDGLELSLRNGYDKNITACALSVNGSITEIDFLYSERQDQSGIAPQTVYTRRYSYARSMNPAVAARRDLDINVLAVVFDDKSGDGDPKLVAAILNARLQSKKQLRHIVYLLNKALDSPGIIDDTVFNGLKLRISSLPTNSERSGEKEDVLRWFGELDDRLSPRERIEHLKETCEALAARL